ncbi:di-heme oxidoredictase family protein [Hyphomicrobium sp.]|uniref:di-heme oxidoreductase family protein n=1 Tax=Hyphomicrobium sp. TaxID=82 RepID=UPI002E320BB5|nr:di-heme oxidoredictase family protein [Hyphomicrobium sp.]HEX2840086.1 di-heme oxidoredictase family protein [Hyphomicrobium sp.]
MPRTIARPVLLIVGLAAAVPLAAGVLSLAVSRGTANPAVDIAPVVQPGEEMPGGGATSRRSVTDRDAFSHFSYGIDPEGESRFNVGNAIFRKLWVAAPSSTQASDGLGPLYNARGCQSCHQKDGRGRPPFANWPDETAVSMFLRLSIPPETEEQKELLAAKRVLSIPDPVYGNQLQNIAIQGHDGEGHMHIAYTDVPVTLAGGQVVTLRKPTYSVTELAYGPMHPKVMLSPRVAPPMIGLGLIEAIPEADIRANADPDDANKDGISGRVNEVWSISQNDVRLGRFGWKAGEATILDQSATAAAGDIGLSNPLLPLAAGDCTAKQPTCLNAPNGNSEKHGGFELSKELLDLVAFYSQNLAVPARRGAGDDDVLKGKVLFYKSGCTACHHPSFTTGAVEGQPHLSKQDIWPYSDFLLHDMGEGLADGRPEGLADGRDWRTPPLWGVGLTEIVNGHTFLLHDGRARNVEEAILWHGGEAQHARDAYAALSREEREALVKFVNSL